MYYQLIYYVIVNGVKLIIIKAQKGGGAVRENSASLRITKGIISNSGVNNKSKYNNINIKNVSPEKNMCWEKRVLCENGSGYHFCAVVIVNILVIITFLGISTRSNDLC